MEGHKFDVWGDPKTCYRCQAHSVDANTRQLQEECQARHEVIWQIVAMQVKVLNDMWIPIREEDAQKMISLLDTDHKSSVDYHDFREFVYMLPEDQVRGLVYKQFFCAFGFIL